MGKTEKNRKENHATKSVALQQIAQIVTSIVILSNHCFFCTLCVLSKGIN
jgi:hypothetical protein